MNFKTYSHLKEILHESENYQEVIHEAFEWIEDDSIFEAYAWAFIKSPVKVTKMFTNQNKLTKSLISQAVIDIDLQNRKEAAKKISDPQKAKNQREKLQQAHDIKKKGLSDKISGIKQRIDDLAGSDSKLQELASNLKTKSGLAAAEKLIKAADGAEQKELQIKIRKSKEKLSRQENIFKEYESNLSTEDKAKGQEQAKTAKSEDDGKSDSTKKDAESSIEEKIEAEKDAINDLVREFNGKKKKIAEARKRSHITQAKFDELMKNLMKEGHQEKIDVHKKNIIDLKKNSK